MTRLVLVLGDLRASRLSEAARAALPRLPRLEQWLARGQHRSAPGGWRHWLRGELPDPALRSMPLASIAAAPLASALGARPVWLATPVHWVAGLDTVRLHPYGLLRLSAEEQQALEQDFARVFEGSGWSLRATGRRELLLAGGTPQAGDAARSHDPALWLGEDPREGLPAGAGSAELRRLGTEIEMWLYEHPVNRQRLSRGQLSATALWIWGGGAPAVAGAGGATTNAAAAWAEDLFVDGLGKIGAYEVRPLAVPWSSLASAAVAGEELLVAHPLGAAPASEELEMLESQWIAPALEYWRRGSVDRATLLAGDHAVTLERSPLSFLRGRFGRTRPWWEALP